MRVSNNEILREATDSDDETKFADDSAENCSMDLEIWEHETEQSVLVAWNRVFEERVNACDVNLCAGLIDEVAHCVEIRCQVRERNV
jgi:hypothetical protein